MYSQKLKNSGLGILIKLAKWSVKAVLVITGIVHFERCSPGYSSKNGKIKFNGREITDKNFLVLNSEFAKDSATAYYKDHAFQYADVASFEAVDANYAKDKNKVYYCDEYNEGQNYYMTKRQTILEVNNAQPSSFVSFGNGYGRDHQHAWFEGKFFKVADVSSLESIDRNFAKDKVHAYLDRMVIDGSDGETFQLLDGNYGRDKNKIYYYFVDGGGKYNICKLHCDIKSFEIINNSYSRDSHNVFFLGHLLSQADPASLKILSAGYAKDKTSVFFHSEKIRTINPDSFEVFKDNEIYNQDVAYAKDDLNVYVGAEKLANAAVGNFRLLGGNYTTDGMHIFYKTMAVKNANSASFQVYPHDIGDADAQDKTSKFHEGVKLAGY